MIKVKLIPVDTTYQEYGPYLLTKFNFYGSSFFGSDDKDNMVHVDLPNILYCCQAEEVKEE